MERDQILRVLRDDLVTAQKRHDAASRHFGEVLHDTTPGAVERVRGASDEYGQKQREAITALIRLNNYLAYGTGPPGFGKS
jgi:hypothetical protein